MSRKHALLVGTATHQDVSYPALPSVRADIHFLGQVLEMPAVGGYEVLPGRGLAQSGGQAGHRGIPERAGTR